MTVTAKTLALARDLTIASLVIVGAASAQDAVPARPAAPEIEINGAAVVDNTGKQANLLTGFYATLATIEICALTIDPGIQAGMDADQARLESSLAMDTATAEKAYARVKADVEKTEPDCVEGSPDRIGIDAVTALYAAQAAAGPAGGASEPLPPPAQ